MTKAEIISKYEEENPCEYCPNSHVRCCDDGTYIVECDLPEDVNPEDVVGSKCVYVWSCDDF